MSFLQTFDQLSFKQVIGITFFVAILLAVPVAVYLVQQQTRIGSRAAYEKPEVMQQEKTPEGPIPENPPAIGRVFPWVGKVGDIVWIQGKNFGSNPKEKKLTIGGVELSDAQIDVWNDDVIQAYIPEGVKTGAYVVIKIGDHPVTKSKPMVIYDQNTSIKLRKDETKIYVADASRIKKVVVWTGDDEIAEQRHDEDINNKLGETVLFDTNNLPILSILILDSDGQSLPYYVDPIEFDF
ncbi:hypothetical protein GYA19_02395 [Candidatus Beckwithbacteria bacterium]|nr:hypothetical protein [Candidatus Beckwithbacteria bacterium]